MPPPHPPSFRSGSTFKDGLSLKYRFVASGFQVQLRGLAAGWDYRAREDLNVHLEIRHSEDHLKTVSDQQRF